MNKTIKKFIWVFFILICFLAGLGAYFKGHYIPFILLISAAGVLSVPTSKSKKPETFVYIRGIFALALVFIAGYFGGLK